MVSPWIWAVYKFLLLFYFIYLILHWTFRAAEWDIGLMSLVYLSTAELQFDKAIYKIASKTRFSNVLLFDLIVKSFIIPIGFI